jgi:MerR HTH family regulatory protein
MAEWNHRPEELGITYRQLDYWTRQGYLRPVQPHSNIRSGGTGYARQWPESELAIAASMGRLIRLGLTAEAAHRVARAGRESWVRYALV